MENGGRLVSGDRGCAREERGTERDRGRQSEGAKKDTKRLTERRKCKGLQKSSGKDRGNERSLSLKGGLLCVHTEPYGATQHMYLDYVVMSGHRTRG